MNEESLFKKAKELKLPIGKYALFGSAPMAARGLKKSSDIDIIITEDLWKDYENKQNWEIKKFSGGTLYLVNDDIELWKNWGPGQWDIEELICEAEIINGLPFVRLEKVLEWKKLNAREKDLKDVEIIEKFLLCERKRLT